MSFQKRVAVGWRGAAESAGVAMLFVLGAAVAVHREPPVSAIPIVLCWGAVLVVAKRDLETFLIPDEATLTIAVLGLVRTALIGSAAGDLWGSLIQSAADGAGAFLVFRVVQVGYRRLRGREGLGYGDVKLAGACGLWLAPTAQVVSLELAAAGAALWLLAQARGASDAAMPFGAFLAPAAWIIVLFGPGLGLS